MKKLKHKPIIYSDMMRLIKNSSDDATRIHLSGIYKDKDCFVSTNGYTLFLTKRLEEFSIFKNIQNESIIDIKPILKNIDMSSINKYDKTINMEFVKYNQVLPTSFKQEFKIKIPYWITRLEKHKKPCYLFFNGEIFSLEKTNDTLFCLDGRYLSKVFDGINKEDQSFTLGFNDTYAPIQLTKENEHWQFLIMSLSF
jgi:hypothetical protein